MGTQEGCHCDGESVLSADVIAEVTARTEIEIQQAFTEERAAWATWCRLQNERRALEERLLKLRLVAKR